MRASACDHEIREEYNGSSFRAAAAVASVIVCMKAWDSDRIEGERERR